MDEIATITIDGKSYNFETFVGTEGERCIDIQHLRDVTGCITLDPGFGSTGSCLSNITFVDGANGILRYRGYPIEELAERASFVEVAYLILYGELPNRTQLLNFRNQIRVHAPIHTNLEHHFSGLPHTAPPMAILSAMLNLVSCFHPEVLEVPTTGEEFGQTASLLLSKVRTVAAFAYRTASGKPINQPNPNLTYCGNFLHMMFSDPYVEYKVSPIIDKAINLFLILHADHEQNCSTTTVRVVGSSRANLFSSVAAGVSALMGPLHGGANVAVIEMLQDIKRSGKPLQYYIDRAKDKKDEFRLMGFGHRVYKNFDPRARILKKHVDEVLGALNLKDELLDIAKELEEHTLKDQYFIERNLYPNVDFYSGLLLRVIGIPLNMYTVLFAIGRMPGWISHWKEMHDHQQRISRPRQIYTGPILRHFQQISDRL
ncbi:citrate synthase [Desulforhopalus vacuolatus]|uniref:citrate synthase n=1 Tax=Desulforhopalus vacuolatus TaxID=40414 RepID=UPI0019667CF8|nr:citrate synthase [Desulforhopalus vacuolatus]MBM9519260.1 citrate synthase [Desulforhopalus vacuolatus]